MKISVKNYHVPQVMLLLSELSTQRMLIGDKIKVKENFDKIAKKGKTIEDLRIEIIISNGGTHEAGIKSDHENFEKAKSEIDELYQLETEISLQIIPFDILKRFEVSEAISIDAIQILAGDFKLNGNVEEIKEVELQPE